MFIWEWEGFAKNLALYVLSKEKVTTIIRSHGSVAVIPAARELGGPTFSAISFLIRSGLNPISTHLLVC